MKNHLVNEQIRAMTVVLIGSDGQKRGEFARYAALNLAKAEELDLVQMSESRPPICKIADYGKMKYEASKSEKKSHAPQQKDLWAKFATEKHDMDIKMKKIEQWLRDGHKVSFLIKLKGRQKDHSAPFRDIAKDNMLKALTPFVAVERKDIKEGGDGIHIMLDPGKLLPKNKAVEA